MRDDMKDDNEVEYYGKKVKDIVRKLIADEKLVTDFYRDAVLAVDPESRGEIAETFKDIADDEYGDHYAGLVDFACKWLGCKVPCGYEETKKLGCKLNWELASKLARGKGPEYYVKKAIESEKDAIKDYEEAIKILDEDMDSDSHADAGNLKGLLVKIYYDEVEHLEMLDMLLHNVLAYDETEDKE